MDKHSPQHHRLRYERQLRGWSQAEVATRIGSDPKSVGRWERGEAFPGPYNRRKLVELFEKNAEELGLIKNSDESGLACHAKWHEDWGEAPHIERFYGREKELARVAQWMSAGHCRMVVVLGIGGVGKTTFATVVARQVKDSFGTIFWRSLQHAPPVESILESYFHFRSTPRQQRVHLPKDLDAQISLLITSLREQRCLLILDNVEAVLQADDQADLYLAGYEGYGRLFQRIGEADHQSCLILTSREKPKEIVPMEGRDSPVRSLTLSGLEQADGQKLLQDKDLSGSAETWAALVRLYSGNPLALKLVSEPIREVFGGDIAGFLQEGEAVFGDIHDLLDQQFHRLSKREQEVMYWLAIEREAVSRQELRANTISSMSKRAFLEVLDSLRRRSMIEASTEGRFVLQPVIMAYVTERFVEQVYQEVEAETIGLFGSHALMKAQAKDYVRNNQVRLILTRVAEGLITTLEKAGSEKKLKSILDIVRTIHSLKSSYVAGNVLNLLVQLQFDLRGADFSHLTVRQAYLQGATLPEVNFAYSDLATSVFTDTFSSILCVAVSPNGELLAAGTTTDEVRLWRADDTTPLFTCLGHVDGIRSVAFSPDSKILASGSEDQTVRLWDTSMGRCLKVLQGHSSLVRSVAFSPNGRIVASGSEDQTVRLWDMSTGRCLNILQGHTQRVRSIAFSSDGSILASGSDDSTVCLWDTNTGLCFKVLQGHTHYVRSIAFSLNSRILASGSEDQTVRVWDTNTGDCLNILQGHSHRVWTVAFSLDSSVIASGSDDQTIRIWDVLTGQCLKVLQGHTNRIWSVAFVTDSNILVSTSEDDTMRFWKVRTGQCLRILQGYSSLIKSVAFSPNGQLLVSGSEDQTVQLWEVDTGRGLKTLKGHANRVRSVAFSPDGATVASGSEDETVRIWDTSTGRCLKTLQGHTHLVRSVTFNSAGSVIASGSHDQTVRLWDVGTGDCLKTLQGHDSLVWCVAFSPDGNVLASGSDDQTIRIWDTSTGRCLKTLRGHTHRIWSLAFSPDGNILASSSDDLTIRLWDASTGDYLKTLQGHTHYIRSVAFSPDGNVIATGSHDRTVRIWDASTGRCLKVLQGHLSRIWSVAFSSDGGTVASGSDDGTIKFWNIHTGKCMRTLRSERPYEDMNITGALGLTEAQKISLKLLGAIEMEK